MENLKLSMLHVQEMSMDEMKKKNGGSGNEFTDAVLNIVLSVSSKITNRVCSVLCNFFW